MKLINKKQNVLKYSKNDNRGVNTSLLNIIVGSIEESNTPSRLPSSMRGSPVV